jgi:hypothetical protein
MKDLNKYLFEDYNDSDELFDIIKLLINKKNITAKEVYKSLSKHDVKNDGI